MAKPREPTSTRINTKCKRAYEILTDTRWLGRIQQCEGISEFGFALLLHYVQLEAALKVIRYWDRLEDGWPDQIKINANWKPLRDLKALDRSKYDLVIGRGGRSLREIRNRVAHEGILIGEKEYASFALTAKWAMVQLRSRLPSQTDLSRKLLRAAIRR